MSFRQEKRLKKNQTNPDVGQVSQAFVQGFLWNDIKDIFSDSSDDVKIYEKEDVSDKAYKTPGGALVSSVSWK